MSSVLAGALHRRKLECSTDLAEMLSYLGIGINAADEFTLESARSAIEECEKECSICGVFRIFAIDNDHSGEGIALDGTEVVLQGHDIRNHLQGAQAVVLIALTLGLTSEIWLNRKRRQSLSGGLYADAAASAYVEAGADSLEREIDNLIFDKGSYLGSRFSPGYGDLSLSVQSELLRALDAESQIGIHLTDEMLMVPTKSITAISGIFDNRPSSKDAGKMCESCIRASTCSLHSRGLTCRGRESRIGGSFEL